MPEIREHDDLTITQKELKDLLERPQGQVVQDAQGDVYQRYGEGWRTFGQHTVFPFSHPKRPLRELA